MSKKAVVVGVDYVDTVAELRGCVNDAYWTAELLTKRFGFSPGILMVSWFAKDDCTIFPPVGQIPNRKSVQKQRLFPVSAGFPLSQIESVSWRTATGSPHS